jgi:hypothetical protein
VPRVVVLEAVAHTAAVHPLHPARMPGHTLAAQQHLAGHISGSGGGVPRRQCRPPLLFQQQLELHFFFSLLFWL